MIGGEGETLEPQGVAQISRGPKRLQGHNEGLGGFIAFFLTFGLENRTESN